MMIQKVNKILTIINFIENNRVPASKPKFKFKFLFSANVIKSKSFPYFKTLM
jgi:hypothetical protein